MGDCYEPSPLISWVHEEVPFIQIGFNNSGRGTENLIDSLDEGLASYYDYFVVSAHLKQYYIDGVCIYMEIWT